MHSMGLVLVGLVALTFFVGVGFILFKVFKKSKFIKKIAIMIANKVLFNSFLRTFIQAYLVFSIACFTNIYALDFSTAGLTIEWVTAGVLSAVVFAAPFSMAAFLHKFQASLPLDKFKNRCHSLYVGLDLKSGYAIHYYPVFTFRRLLAGFLIVFA